MQGTTCGKTSCQLGFANSERVKKACFCNLREGFQKTNEVKDVWVVIGKQFAIANQCQHVMMIYGKVLSFVQNASLV